MPALSQQVLWAGNASGARHLVEERVESYLFILMPKYLLSVHISNVSFATMT